MFYVLRDLHGSWYPIITNWRDFQSDINLPLNRYGSDVVFDCVCYVGF